MRAWVLIRRYEWESQAQQTESCDVFLFTKREDALRKTRGLVKSDIRKYGDGTRAVYEREVSGIETEFSSRFPRHLVQLTDGDNVVYELYRKEVKG